MIPVLRSNNNKLRCCRSNGCCRFQPARRRHWYDAVRRVVATVAHESKQLSTRSGTNRYEDRGKCFQASSMSPCSVAVFCCSTTQPSDERQTQTTTEASSRTGRPQTVTRACDNVYHHDSQPSLDPARSDVTQMRRLRGETYVYTYTFFPMNMT